MKLRFTIFLLLCLSFFTANAQKKKVEFTDTYEIPSSMPEDVALGIDIEKAKSEAIANEFGEQLRSQSTVSLSNDESLAHGNADILEINSRIVPGIWLGDEEGYPKYKKILEDNRFKLQVTVKGWAAKRNNEKIPFEVKVLRKGTDPSYASTYFYDGDQMFVWMKSPVKGYACIYLYDHQSKKAYCLLPYSKSQDGAYAVNADEDYVFFAPDKEKDNTVKVDRLVMTSEKPTDYNVLYVLFSPEKFANANSKYGQSQINDKLILPRSMDYKDFMKWKANLLTADDQMEERCIILQIKKR